MKSLISAVTAVAFLTAFLAVLSLSTGYFEYRKNMNDCLQDGGKVVKMSAGLKCIKVSDKITYQ